MFWWVTNQGFKTRLVDVKNEKKMVSLQAFPSLPSLAPETPFPFPFKRLPQRLMWVSHVSLYLSDVFNWVDVQLVLVAKWMAPNSCLRDISVNNIQKGGFPVGRAGINTLVTRHAICNSWALYNPPVWGSQSQLIWNCKHSAQRFLTRLGLASKSN